MSVVSPFYLYNKYIWLLAVGGGVGLKMKICAEVIYVILGAPWPEMEVDDALSLNHVRWQLARRARSQVPPCKLSRLSTTATPVAASTFHDRRLPQTPTTLIVLKLSSRR